MTRIAAFVVLLGGCSLGMQSAAAQTYACEPSSSAHAAALKAYITRLVTSSDAATVSKRQLYQLPVASASVVQIVTTKSVCRQAAEAYHAAVRGANAPKISRTVAVVKVGTSRYAVIDPQEREGEFELNVIFDANFTPLVTFQS